MNYSDEIMVSYLLGELSEEQRTELEAEYFAGPGAFDRLERLEADLIDDYVRGRLNQVTRVRFERAYLSNPNRRERLKFAETLAIRLDQSQSSVRSRVRGGGKRQAFFSFLTPPRRALAFSMAIALLVLGSASVWLLIQSRRLSAELARRDAMQTREEQHGADLQRQLTEEQKRNQELAAELQQALSPQGPQTKPSPGAATPAFVTLLLVAIGVRDAGATSPTVLAIPKGTEQVHVHLTLKDNDYANYQVVLRAIAGPEIFNRGNFKPKINKSGATFSFSLPASEFTSGDYMLTLRGALQGGEFEDVSKSLFRVEKK